MQISVLYLYAEKQHVRGHPITLSPTVRCVRISKQLMKVYGKPVAREGQALVLPDDRACNRNSVR